jgi:S-adenosylmethionine hydrolase
VGTERRAVAVATEQAVLVGPDNGLLLPVVLRLGPVLEAVALTGPRNTFAGRDVFAPAAARAAAGEAVERLGERIDPATLAGEPVPEPTPEGARLRAEVLWVDRFGNAQLNASPSHLTPTSLTTGGATYDIRTVYAYGELEPGEIGLVVDSYGLLSVSLSRDSAAARLGLRPGDHVLLSP